MTLEITYFWSFYELSITVEADVYNVDTREFPNTFEFDYTITDVYFYDTPKECSYALKETCVVYLRNSAEFNDEVYKEILKKLKK